MIHEITNTKNLRDVYFEDKNDVVSSQEKCYLINAWYFFYFSTIESAQKKAKEMGISDQVVKAT
jgi:hypothetical protein